MDYQIRNANKEDMSAVYGLICELAAFEKEEDQVSITKSTLEEDGFGTQPKFHCFVATVNSEIVGMALIYPRYSTWKGSIFHLEDLIVNQEYRGKGIGNALLNTVVRYAAERGAQRLNWEVLDWNEGAIRFYERKGAKVFRDWDVVQLDATGINSIVSNL
ncbi:MAG: GNAT family N-acetyltransferase [Flavobacteriaceae bacterium]|nr:GNAT family N-acetyltransferase [Flavobacteriaceae bacterium]